jgi:probable HAF family extracellular repeat protein
MIANKRNFVLVYAFLLSSMTGLAIAQSYTVTDLGSLGGTPTANAINASGEVVGSSKTAESSITHAFYWTLATGMVDLGTLGGNVSEAFGINSHGIIVGGSNQTENASTDPFIWSPTGGFLALGINGADYAVNDRGQVAGVSGNNGYAFRWTRSGGKVLLGTLGGSNTSPYAISPQGDVVGFSFIGNKTYHAFLWNQSAGMADLGTLGGINSYALGINSSAQVVGWATVPGANFPYHAFFWTKLTGMRDLGTFGGDYSLALGINDAGQVVGSADLAGDTQDDAFLWTAGGGMQDLNAAIPQNSGWLLNSANAINGAGQIVGDGTYNGEPHAFLLTPAGAPLR